MYDKLKTKLFNEPEWAVSAGVFFIYWMINKSFTGPVILWDEIGYLANAALVSGHMIDGANSWHFGYSFVLAPLFVIFSEPSQIWQAVMALNALLWSFAVIATARVLRLLQPNYTNRQIFVALLISFAYPTWISISGFALTTTLFVPVYLLSILTFFYWKPGKPWTIIPHCLFAGYLYWIHPVGLAVCIASFMVIGFVSLKVKNYYSAIVGIILLAALVTAYREIIDSWYIMLATPDGYDPLFRHYPDSDRLIGKLFGSLFWLQLITKSAGQLSYLIVSSFGLILLGILTSFGILHGFADETAKLNGHGDLLHQAGHAYLVLSFLGIMATGVIYASGGDIRVDQWIYGRYTEMVVMPFIGLGYLSVTKKNWLYGAALFVFITGIILNRVADFETHASYYHTVAFWPQYVILETNFFYWMTAGALVLLLTARVWKSGRVGNLLVISLLLLIFVFSAVVSNKYHHMRLSGMGYSRPSSFVEVIRENYPPGTCVGFNPQILDTMYTFEELRYNLHLFYLYDYNYRRMTPEEWLESCEGPYFTYRLDDLYDRQDIILVGQERFSKIYLVAKNDSQPIISPEMKGTESDVYWGSGWSLDNRIYYNGEQLAGLPRQVGYYENGSIYSDGTSGLLLSGPGVRLGSGRYEYTVWGEVIFDKDARLYVVSGGGSNRHAETYFSNKISQNNSVIGAGNFTLEDPVNDLELRVYVRPEDIIRIDGFEIQYVAESGN